MPRPWTVTTFPRSRSCAMARRTVTRATPYCSRQFCLTGESGVRRELPGIDVSFDVCGHLDRHSHGGAVIDSGGSVIQGHGDHGRCPVTCEDT